MEPGISGGYDLEASHVKVVGDGSGTRRKGPEKDSELVIKAGSPAAVSGSEGGKLGPFLLLTVCPSTQQPEKL